MIEFTPADKPFGLYYKSFDPVEHWIRNVVTEEGFEPGDINIINCSDTYLLEINQKYLNHHYYTDVITFDYVVENVVSGDIFISEDRIAENAEEYNTTENEEFLRVIVHGILHLCGYKDHSDTEKQKMHEKENYYLKKF